MAKQVKDLKLGDIIYLLDTEHYFVSSRNVESIERDEWCDSFKISWKEEEGLSYGYADETDTQFWEEIENEDEDIDEDNERLIFLNKEDLVSWVERIISRIREDINTLP